MVRTTKMSQIEKPEYKIPSMEEIEQVEWNGYNVISTFSGCGGSSLGYRMAGFKVLWANEFISIAAETYRLNHSAIIDERDIREVQSNEILETIGLQKGELDLMDGSPPCDSFSTAGKGSEKWGKEKTYLGKKQRTDDLFFEYARLIEGIQPKIFIAENVSGLVKGKAKGYFKLILQRLIDCGYIVKARLLDAQWLGVPQMRQRIIFIGVRKDLDIEIVYPKPFKYRYTVRDVLPWIIDVKQSVFNGTDQRSTKGKPCPCINAIGGVGAALGSHWHCEVKKDGHVEKRKFSISELKRICAFPDDFQLIGSFTEQWARLGLSVPPVMMYHIAKTVRDEILNKLPKEEVNSAKLPHVV